MGAPRNTQKTSTAAKAALDFELREWARQQAEKNTSREHRCGQCFGPLGKSAIRCKNEPVPVDHTALREHARAVNEWAATQSEEPEPSEPETGARP